MNLDAKQKNPAAADERPLRTPSCIEEPNQITDEDQEQRDKLLRRLLKTPPQPRPKRERGNTKNGLPCLRLMDKIAKSAADCASRIVLGSPDAVSEEEIAREIEQTLVSVLLAHGIIRSGERRLAEVSPIQTFDGKPLSKRLSEDQKSELRKLGERRFATAVAVSREQHG